MGWSHRNSGHVTALALAITALTGLAGFASAAENVHDGLADPSTVQSGEKVQPHKFSYHVHNVSNDGSSDLLYVTFPDEVPKENLSSYSGNVEDHEGNSISISSSMSIVDGPDGDGVQETLKIGVQPEGERETRDLIVNFTGGEAHWPEVDSTTDYPMKASVTDSALSNVELLQFATVTVETNDSTTNSTSDSTDDSTTDDSTSDSTDDSTSDSTDSSSEPALDVATTGVGLVSPSSAELVGDLVETGGAQTVDAQFTYWVEGSKSSTETTTSVEHLSTTREYEVEVTGLQAGTTYAFQADAQASDGDQDTGTVKTFTTQEAQASGGSGSTGTSGGTTDGTTEGTGGSGESNASGGNQAPLGAAPALAGAIAAALAAARLRRG